MPDIAFSLPSFAKINLGLRIVGKRDDGFHDIFTVFQTVSLHDTLTFAPADEMTLTCDDPAIPVDNSNLILRAATALSERIGAGGKRRFGARVHLEKRIPSPGGLGGGSSNAATALIGLSRLWNLPIDSHEIRATGTRLGSDVPFFLTGGTAFGTGRGIDIESIADFKAENLLIVTPGICVITKDAFRTLNAPSLTSVEANRILGVYRSEAESSDLRFGAMKNDFEATVFAAFPEIARVKQRLLDLGASQAALSGSGASVFGIFDRKETRQTAIKALDEHVDWRKFAVATISRNDYREALKIAF